MTIEWQWLEHDLVIALHSRSLVRFGGAEGVRDMGLLQSALAHPRNVAAYRAETNVHDIAAAYCFALVRNHPFVDGNKRIRLPAARAFLFRNGRQLESEDDDIALTIIDLAAGRLTECELADWIAARCTDR